MARARNIKPGFFTNEDLVEIDPLGRLLFIGLWTLADREGRLDDRPKKIKMEVFPCDNCDVDELLEQLAEKGFILRYQVGSGKYIQIVNFSKHQNPHKNEKPSEIPAPNCEKEESAPEESSTTPVMERTTPEKAESTPEKAVVTPADSLIPDSPFSDSLNPDSRPPHPDSHKDRLDEDDVREAHAALALVMYNGDTLRSGFELQEVNRWLSEFPKEIVLEAIRKVGLSGGEVKRPMSVIEKQLWEWHGKGLLTVDAIRQAYVQSGTRAAPHVRRESQRERVARMMQEREGRRQSSG